MPDKLPKGWVKAKLGEICLPVATVQPGATPNAEFTYFDIGGIDNESNRIAETKAVTGRDAPSRARQVVRTGDILFSTVRTYLKKIARIERDYPNPIASTGFTVIRAAEGVSSKFLFFRVLSEDFLQPLHALQSGSSYPAVRDKDVFAQPIPLPPSREQERIVAKLDALLSRVSAGETAVRRARERLKRYRSAVLNAAVTGEFTREWRKANKPSETGAQLLKRILNERRVNWEEAKLKRFGEGGSQPKDDKWKSIYVEPTLTETGFLPKLPKTWAWASLEMIAELGSGISVSQNRVVENPVEVPYPGALQHVINRGDRCEAKRQQPTAVLGQAQSSMSIVKTRNRPWDRPLYGWKINAACLLTMIIKSPHVNHFFPCCLPDYHAPKVIKPTLGTAFRRGFESLIHA